MGVHIGREGIIKVDGVAVASLRSFSVEETGDTVEDTSMTSTSRTFKPTLTSFSGSADVYWDEDDTAQTALVVNSEPQIVFFPEGDGVGNKNYTGNCIVTGVSKSSRFDEKVEASITFQGVGALVASA